MLTPAGKHLLEQGRLLLAGAEALENSTQAVANGWESLIRIGIDSLYNQVNTYELLATFLKAHSNINLHIQEEVLFGGWEALIRDDVDIMIGSPGPVPQNKGIQSHPLCNYDPVFAVPPTHHLASVATPITSEHLQKERIIVVRDSSRESVDWSLGLSGEQRVSVPTIECKIKAQVSGLGVGFLPRERIQTLLKEGALIQLEVEGYNDLGNKHFLAWKAVNHGKGLLKLREILKNLANTDEPAN